MSESTYKTNNSRVYGKGWSYNLTNQKDAERLCQTLNELENTVQLHKNIDEQFDRIQKQLIQTNLSLNILKDDMEKLTTQLQQVKE